MQNNINENPWLQSIKDQDFLINVDDSDIIINIEPINNAQEENSNE